MSLLLDALKKAAEKKAAKSDQDPVQGTGDETVVDNQNLSAGEDDETAAPDSAATGGADDTVVKQRPDDTEIKAEAAPDAERTEVQPEESPETQQTEHTDLMGTEDETLIFDDEDLSEFLGEPKYISEEVSEEAELTQQTSIDEANDQTEHEIAEAVEKSKVADLDHGEDMSLLLVDDEQTVIRPQTTMSNLQAATKVELLRDGNTTEGLQLEDIPESTGTTAPTNRTAGSVTTQVGVEATTTRADSTATATYAPDNYDRTLMRVQNDEASKLFAGMKSDADVAMTPDYAKKVFHSKSSAKRWQNLRVYSGITVAILLVIGVIGLFEFQAQMETIDNSLRPLTRDPMPGVIQPVERDEAGREIAAAPVEVDERTRQLVEGADDASAEPELAEESTEETVEVATAAVEENSDTAISAPESAPLSEDIQVAAEAALSEAPSDSVAEESTQVTDVAEALAAAEEESIDESNLSISMSTKTADKDIWLRDAYAAYRSGNDELALEKYNQVLELEPGNRNALLARAAIAIQDDRGSDAMRDYQRLLEANPRDSLAMSSMLAISSVSPKQAESQLKVMLRDDPVSPYLNFALGNVFGVQNRWQEAQRHYFTALENNPDDPNYAYNLAVSLEHIQKPDVAADFYRRALENYDMGLATFSRSIVEQRLGVLQ